jgi:hypothetical protein
MDGNEFPMLFAIRRPFRNSGPCVAPIRVI